MAQNQQYHYIGEFINSQVIQRGLDERTLKAYQQDLKLFYLWLETGQCAGRFWETIELEDWMEIYLDYLFKEKGLQVSTIKRKQRVFSYYLTYLVSQGIIKKCRPLKPVNQFLDCRKIENTSIERENIQLNDFCDNHLLNKKEVDSFFQAINQEYIDLDSDFRKRVCLRNQVMMELIFYHRIEISELLRMEVTDYNRKTSTLIVRRKREKEQIVSLFSRTLQKQMVQWLDVHEYFERDEEYNNQMFLSKLGKPLSMKMVINIFDKYRVKAGIDREYKPKDLKNSLKRYAEEMVWELG